jgi:hypothetical protein
MNHTTTWGITAIIAIIAIIAKPRSRFSFFNSHKNPSHFISLGKQPSIHDPKQSKSIIKSVA